MKPSLESEADKVPRREQSDELLEQVDYLLNGNGAFALHDFLLKLPDAYPDDDDPDVDGFEQFETRQASMEPSFDETMTSPSTSPKG